MYRAVICLVCIRRSHVRLYQCFIGVKGRDSDIDSEVERWSASWLRRVCCGKACTLTCEVSARMVVRSLSVREAHRSTSVSLARHVTVIKSVSISTTPNVHFAVHLRQRLTLSNTLLTKPMIGDHVCLA